MVPLSLYKVNYASSTEYLPRPFHSINHLFGLILLLKAMLVVTKQMGSAALILLTEWSNRDSVFIFGLRAEPSGICFDLQCSHDLLCNHSDGCSFKYQWLAEDKVCVCVCALISYRISLLSVIALSRIMTRNNDNNNHNVSKQIHISFAKYAAVVHTVSAQLCFVVFRFLTSWPIFLTGTHVAQCQGSNPEKYGVSYSLVTRFQ